jgi:DNA-binding transcriptional MerR regulator
MSTPENMVDIDAAPAAEEIPDKLYFRIGEVARLAGIKPYVLRFWETEFPALGPKKSGTGHRLYRRKDVEMVLEIKRLLYEQRFTIEGARKHLEMRPRSEMAHTSAKPAKKAGSAGARAAAHASEKAQGDLFGGSTAALETVRQELRDILQLLK